MKHIRILYITAVVLFIITVGLLGYQNYNENMTLKIATTTSVDNTGLLDILVEKFESETHYTVKVIARGTGAAVDLAKNGEVDAILVHAPELEMEFVSQGYGINRTTLWYNYFILAGPEDDPANVSMADDIYDAFTRIYIAGENGLTKFFSRGDNSGTNIKELKIWNNTDYHPSSANNSWYLETGTGMSATLTTASESKGYTLSDFGTFTKLFSEKTIDLISLHTGDQILYNPYSYIIVSPEMYPKTNIKAAQDFLNFLTKPSTNELVNNLKVGDTPLFTVIDKP